MIRFNDVSFHYGGEHGSGDGVDHINLKIQDGETVVLCGLSGCGKTTLTRLVNGLAPNFYEGQMEGDVYIDDHCVNKTSLHKISGLVGSVFQNPKSQFFNVDTTGELVFGCENQGLSRKEIKKRLEVTKATLKLDNLLNRNIFELSGGEKQQIACGSVYAADPKVFVMDEPSSNLDKKAIHRLKKLLKEIKQHEKTIVISEHRLYYLMDIADRFIYMKDGRIEKIFSNSEMKKLSESELRSMGLRCTDLQNVDTSVEINDAKNREQISLEAIDVSCSKGSTKILDIDRLQLPENSIVALIGDNGSGKSTLSEGLCGIGEVSGTVAFQGVYQTNKSRAGNSFMVMQDVNHQLFSESVLEEVTLQTDTSKEIAIDYLKRLGLDSYVDRHPSSLSGGQKQRVAVASALCAGKKIIFYDEPTSGLDRRGMERFGDLLRSTQNDISTSVIITHDLELILQCCTHVIHIENGRVSCFYPLNQEGVRRVKYYFLSDCDDNTSKKRERKGSIEKILQYAGEDKKLTYLSTILMILAAAANVLPYILIYQLINDILMNQKVTLSGTFPLIGGILLCMLLHVMLYTKALDLSHTAAYHTLTNIRYFLQERIEKQSLGNVKDMGTGAMKKLFTDDIDSIEMVLAHVIPEGIANITVPAVVLIIMMYFDWQLTFMTLVVILFGVIAMNQMYSVGMNHMGSYFAATKRLNNTIIEYVNGMEVVKIFNRTSDSEANFGKTVREYRDFALAWYKVCWPWMALYGSIFTNVTLYVLPLGALMILLGNITLSKFILILCMSFGIGPLLLHCITFMSGIPQVSYKIQALEKALDMPALKTTDEDFHGKDHRVSFEDVHFGYGDDEILKGISFTAEENQMTALVGESGSGKSTIAKLMVHYYDIVSGSIAIGGQDITEMSLGALNDRISYVSQELFLFDKTILENIRLGRPSASDEEVKEAARKAQCEDFIIQLPNGYDTLAGLAGNKLSGGQRQRIAFARAILKDAPIVVLDEATAFIDPENEEKMNRAIRSTIHSKTVIVIAHRLRSIVNAEKIIVLEDGGVNSTGTHEELLVSCEKYRTLWEASEKAANWNGIDGGESVSC